jgi:sulfoxide reductase heme-binding subunit YedZ
VRPEPLHYLWWLISRASGVVALVLVSLSVLMGLSMAARAIPRPAWKRVVARLHEHVALAALSAVGLHGASLLGDSWLKPGLRGIVIPFALPYRPAFTGAGIIAGYLMVLIGPSFYVRRRIGAGRWRKVHRVGAAIWALSVAHTLGAGSDASALWLRAVVLAPVAPLAYLLVLRAVRSASGSGQRRPALAPATGAALATHRRPRHDQHGAARVPDQRLPHAARHQPRDRTPATGAQHDQVERLGQRAHLVPGIADGG